MLALWHGSTILGLGCLMPKVNIHGVSPGHLIRSRCGRRGYTELSRVTSSSAGPSFFVEPFLGDYDYPLSLGSLPTRGKAFYG